MLKVLKEENGPNPSDNKPWYSKGLNFKCTECGQCCTGAPGYIWVTEQEISAIANYLQLTVNEFSRRYLRKVNNRFSLTERSRTYDCIFLKDKKCQVYPVRPIQCQTFPWWPENLHSEEAWSETASLCEGINREAPVVSINKIEEQLARQESSIKNG